MLMILQLATNYLLSPTQNIYISQEVAYLKNTHRIGRDDTNTYFYTKNDESASTVRFTFDNTDTEWCGG